MKFRYSLLSILVFGLAWVQDVSATTPSLRPGARYADPSSCVECHREACDDWSKSDHSHSMDHANAATVLGNFSDIRFVHIGFDDLLEFDDDALKILVDDVFRSLQPPWPMREYDTVERSANSIHGGMKPAPYNVQGRKFKPPSEPRFDDFALACFDVKLGLADKLRRVMDESQRKEFDAETDYRKALKVNRPGDISGAQSRIVGHLRGLIETGKISHEKIPSHCAVFRMYRDGEKYMAETDVGVFEVLFTLGIRPLQQYLVEIVGGRLQCLPVAWDSVDRRWFHLYPKEQIPKNDPLHWTKPLQNWNHMCADCHTTDFDKNFDTNTFSYRSTFTEMNVGCQSCHGPSGKHVETARKNALRTSWKNDIPLEVAVLSGMDGSDMVRSCAFCHTRRRVLRQGPKPPLSACLDYFVAEIQDRPIYYPDGQLLEEAFEFGSFMQSKMASKGIGCTNCHEPHSLKLKFEGNRLCTQCHAPSIYDTVRHHFHPDATKPGTQCVECHFPQSTYMIVDPRRDHSIRKPSPELTIKAGVPNSCTLCHQDREKGETLDWAYEHVERWYAKSRESQVGYSHTEAISKHYALALEAGRRGVPKALPPLEEVVRNKTQRDHRDIVRASALSLFGRLTASDQVSLIFESLDDRSPLVRLAAVEAFARQPVDVKLKYLPVKLGDPLLAIRLEAVRALADASDRLTDESERKAFEAASREYVDSCRALNDQAASYLNLAVFEHDLQASKRRQLEAWFDGTIQNLHRQGGSDIRASLEEAARIRNEYLCKLTARPLEHYRQSLRVDPEFAPSRINLAMLHHERGENEEAEREFREVLRIDPEQGDAAYSLGLLLAETGRLDEAGEFLKKAADLRPGNARIRYNLALLMMQQEKRPEARKELETALKAEPDNSAFLHALAALHLQEENRNEAIRVIDRLIKLEPGNPQWKALRRQAERGRITSQ